MFEAATTSRTSSQLRVSPPRATQMCVEHVDLSEYTVPLEAMPGWPEARCPSEIGHVAPDPVTPSFGSGDLTDFEVPVVETGIRHGGLASSGLCADNLPARWVRSCLELPGYARGWVLEPSPAHSTMLYTMMQVDGSLEAQAVHGRASTEQT